MKATDIFSQRIIAHNCDIDESLKQEVIESLTIHNDRLPFNYERLLNSGTLRALLKDPKCITSGDIQFREHQDGSSYNGLLLMKGADYILPLIFLRNALIARIDRNAQETEVLIWPGIRGDVVTDKLDLWEAEDYIEEIKSIYNLHFNLTRGYYKRHVEKLADEECKNLLNEIENLDFTVAILQ